MGTTTIKMKSVFFLLLFPVVSGFGGVPEDWSAICGFGVDCETGKCMKDSEPGCANWAAEGDCRGAGYDDWMHQYCCASCGYGDAPDHSQYCGFGVDCDDGVCHHDSVEDCHRNDCFGVG